MTDKKMIIDDILQRYLKNGSSKKTILEIRPILFNIVENIKDKTPIELIQHNLEEIIKESQIYLNKKNLKDIDLIYGLSSSVYAFGDKDWYLSFYGGYTNYDKKHEIKSDTLFDVASITKLYTLILKDKLVEFGYFNDDTKIIDLLPEYSNMEDFTIEDLSRLCGELRTIGNISTAKDKKEALEMLKTIFLYSKDRTTNHYSDFPAILTSLAIAKKFNELHDVNFDFEDVLNIFILEKYGMNNSMFKPNKQLIVAGNGNNQNLVHDPKTRILGGISGAAGLFSTPQDQAKLAKAIFKVNSSDYDYIEDIASPENIKKYGTVIFPNSPRSNKGHFGLFQKDERYEKFFCPQDYSNNTFSQQGYTGSYVTFDPINKIHNSIFLATIRPDLQEELKNNDSINEYIINQKPNGYMEGFHTYQDVITRNSLIIKILKEFLTKTQEDSEIKLEFKLR